MLSHHADPGVFIRSMATRGHWAGWPPQPPIWRCCWMPPAKKFVLVETVGVGQDEVEIAKLADVTVVVLVPGMGDDVQAIKAGIMEIADVFVINKADQPGADRLEREILALQSLSTRAPPMAGRVRPSCARSRPKARGSPRRWPRYDRFLAALAQRIALSPTGACACARCCANGCSNNLRILIFRLRPKQVAARRSDPYTIIR